MTGQRSFRSQLRLGSALWTIGVLLVVSVSLTVFLATHPAPHRVILEWFVTLPAAIVVLVGAVSMAAGARQIRRGLSAVDRLRDHLAAVRRGAAAQLGGEYPAEVQPLVDELNALLVERDARLASAAAAAGDLAHGLKTPLAILALDAERLAAADHVDVADSMSAQVERMRRHVEYHLAGARAAATGGALGRACLVAPAIDGIIRALDRVYCERGLRFESQVSADLAVRCPREDLDEMLGNLLDNACKWGRSVVRVSGTSAGDRVTLIIEDDGDGLDPQRAHTVLARGVRADERVPGSGLGLAIVRRVAELCGGAIVLDRSPLGGVRAQLTLGIGHDQ